jgi:glyoxylase-like metal-dependent hydrolase (beta-lactamase superfamily II)
MTLPAVPLGVGLSYIDLRFLERANAIATAVISAPGQVALVDPGPATCLDTLELGLNGLGLSLASVTDLLLTHIHLDHAGATGTIVRRHPHVRVHVHERGATHLVDPARLLASAARLYGTNMERLWGEFAAVPAANIRALRGGEQVTAGGRTFEVAYTPGHASHHVSYFDRASGIAFVGDTAGIRINGGYVLPPTPPPDIDLELWQESAARIEAWGPQTLFLTHFGPVNDVRPHFQALLENLSTAAGWVKASLEEPGTDEARGQRFVEQLDREFRRQMPSARPQGASAGVGDAFARGGAAAQLASYRVAAPPEVLWLGLARYWRKRAG